MSVDDRIQLRHPEAGKTNARIAPDAYAVARGVVLAIIPEAEPSISLDDYLVAMKARLANATGWDRSLSAGWYAMAMKLDLEARGELKRINKRPPQRLVRA